MKFCVTPELATLLRTVRSQNNVSAKELALHLGKSPSFLSKLEGGMIKYIRKEMLTDILLFISRSEDFYGEALPSLFRTLRSFMEEDRLPAQLWLLQYDVAERPVRIPASMAEDMAQRLAALEATAADTAGFINENVDSEMANAFPVNEMVTIDSQAGPRLLFRTELSPKEISDILSVPNYETRLMSLINLVYIMFRFSVYGKERRKMPPDLAIQVLKNTDQYLDRYQVNSLVRFAGLTSSEEYTRRQMPLLSTVPASAQRLAADVSAFFEEAASVNALNTAKVLKNFTEMIAWDPAFTMKLLSLPFADLEGLSYQNKRKLLDELTELLNRYDSLSDFEKKWEDY